MILGYFSALHIPLDLEPSSIINRRKNTSLVLIILSFNYLGLFYGEDSYFSSGWNRMDGTLVVISLVDTAITLCMGKTNKIFGMLRVFRLVRALRPLR